MKKQWWQKDVFYQIYPASFYDSNNDGIGDLAGIDRKLNYLKALGINVVWLSPIYQSPMIDNGYDISDYYQINPIFGTMHDFNKLLNDIHEKNMKLILDLVVNHTSDKHPWFQEAIRNSNSKYRNYYIFRKGINGNPPNNWRSNFGYGSAWSKVSNSDDYYLHVFSSKQPDLNWENPELRNDIYKMINWWLDKVVDGFIIDAITFIKKDQDFESLPADGSDGLTKIKKKSENRPGIQDFLHEMKAKCFNDRNIVTVGETSGIKNKDFPMYIGNDGVFSMAFDFRYADIDVESGSEWYRRTRWQPNDLKKLIDESQEIIEQTPGGWSANFLENHDQPRSVSKYIKDSEYQVNGIGAKALAMMYFFLRGCPFIYQGQELGIINAKRTNINQFNDVSSISNYDQMIKLGFSPQKALEYVNLRSRDNARTPFPWNNTVNNGFNQGHQPWIKMNENSLAENAEEQIKDSKSVFRFYQKLIKIRKKAENIELLTGKYTKLNNLPKEIIGYQRGDHFKVLVNLSSLKVPIELSHYDLLCSNYEQSGIKSLRPYEAVLIRKKEF